MAALDSITGMPKLPITSAARATIPTSPRGYMGPKEIAPIEEELGGEILAAKQKVGEADINIEKAKREEKARELETKASGLEKFSQEVEQMPEKLALTELRKQQQGMEFIPTKDTAQDIAGLFSLVSVVGMVLGRKNAQGAMSAMNGMLEGYEKGRQDLFKKEASEFDRNFKAMQTKVTSALAEFQEALKIRQTNKEAGELREQAALSRMESPLLKAIYDKQGPVAVVERLQEIKKTTTETMPKLINDLQKARDDRAAAAERAQMRMTVGKKQLMQGSDGKMYSFNPETNEFSPVALPAGVESVSKPGARAGQNALTFASRVYGNIENSAQDLKNIISLPATAQLPVLSGLLNVEKDTALKSIESMAARTITKPENRAFQQVSDQLGAALSRMEAQGLASGATKANVASFNSLRPAAGDNAINMAIYLARVKQEIETGIKVLDKMPGATTEQKEAVKVILQDLNTFVPYNVQDALDVLKKNNKQLGDKMTRLVSQPTVANNLNIGLTQQPTQEKPSVDFEKERSSAKAAIANGKDEAAVKARFKERTGQEL